MKTSRVPLISPWWAHLQAHARGGERVAPS